MSLRPSRAVTDPDLQQCSPARMASMLGWPRPQGWNGWSGSLLLRLAERKFYENRQTKETAA